MSVGSDTAGPGYSSWRLNSRPAFATSSLSADRQGKRDDGRPLRVSPNACLTIFRNIANIGGQWEPLRLSSIEKKTAASLLLDWLDDLPRKPREKCVARLGRLEELGHELRRPEADFLRDGIYELRAAHQRVQYRMLYFFSGKAFVVVSHGLVKEETVPPKEIDRAVERKRKFESDPASRAFRGED